MKQSIIFAIASLMVASFANAQISGKEVFEKRCMSCHQINLPQGMMQPKESQAFKEAMRSMKAPPMSKIAQMAKDKHPSKEAFVHYVTDFITHPDATKSVCMKKAIEGFGLMPAIGKTMDEKEKVAVAEWMYGLKVDKKTKMLKCGEGKCGGGMGKKEMKCASGMMKKGQQMMEKVQIEMHSRCGSGLMQKGASMMKCAPGKCGKGD